MKAIDLPEILERRAVRLQHITEEDGTMIYYEHQKYILGRLVFYDTFPFLRSFDIMEDHINAVISQIVREDENMLKFLHNIRSNNTQ